MRGAPGNGRRRSMVLGGLVVRPAAAVANNARIRGNRILRGTYRRWAVALGWTSPRKCSCCSWSTLETQTLPWAWSRTIVWCTRSASPRARGRPTSWARCCATARSARGRAGAAVGRHLLFGRPELGLHVRQGDSPLSRPGLHDGRSRFENGHADSHRQPREVGADRIVNAVAAVHRFGGRSLCATLGPRPRSTA